MFCKHDFEIIDKITMESAFEQADRTRTGSMSSSDAEIFFRKKIIILLKCPLCKKLKKIVETNP